MYINNSKLCLYAGDYDNMEKYYLTAIDFKNSNISIYNLACYYEYIKDYDNMYKYCDMITNRTLKTKLLNKILNHLFSYKFANKNLEYLDIENNIKLNKYILFNNINTETIQNCYICYNENVFILIVKISA